MSRVIAASLSTGIHAVVLACMLVSCSQQKTKPPPKPNLPKTEKVVRASIRFLPSNEAISDNMLNCPKVYRGVGIKAQLGTDRIFQLVPGGPAEKAGIQVGDVLVDDGGFQVDKYMPGYKLKMKVRRGDRLLVFEVVVKHICYDD